MSLFNQIKNTADSRPIETLKEDIRVAYAHKEKTNTDATKTVYHALCESLIEREGVEELDKLEGTF